MDKCGLTCQKASSCRVPEAELEGVIRFVEGLHIREIAEQVMHTLFQALAMRYEFSLQEIEEH